jgi:hypothetical protein
MAMVKALVLVQARVSAMELGEASAPLLVVELEEA